MDYHKKKKGEVEKFLQDMKSGSLNLTQKEIRDKLVGYERTKVVQSDPILSEEISNLLNPNLRSDYSLEDRLSEGFFQLSGEC